MLDSAVVGPGWISEADFLTGIALVQAMPGPLFNFSAYVGKQRMCDSNWSCTYTRLAGEVGSYLGACGCYLGRLCCVCIGKQGQCRGLHFCSHVRNC